MFSLFSILGLDKILGKILWAVIIAGVLFVGYHYWINKVKREAQQEWNQKQIEQVQKENQKFIEHLTEVNKNQEKIIDDLSKQKNDLEKKYGDLEKHLNDPVVVKKYIKKPTSDVLKRTFKELSR